MQQPPGFQGLGFATGVLRGARCWRVTGPEYTDTVGTLAGMFYRQVWTPGVNEALCMKQPTPGVMLPPGMVGSPPMRTDIDYQPPSRGHLPNCRCGFYGYYDGSNDYYQGDARYESLVTGMIEAWGEVLIGPRGFRATKARIVALMLQPNLPVYDFVLEKYPGIPVFHDFDMMERAFPNEDGGARDNLRTITLEEDE